MSDEMPDDPTIPPASPASGRARKAAGDGTLAVAAEGPSETRPAAGPGAFPGIEPVYPDEDTAEPDDAKEEEPEDGKATFVVTSRAGPRVAGKRVHAQQRLRLTEAEAESELLAGSIVRKGERLHPQLLASARPRDPKDASKAA